MEMKPLEINPSCPTEENDVSVLIPVGDQLPEAHLSTDVPEKTVPIQITAFHQKPRVRQWSIRPQGTSRLNFLKNLFICSN